MMKKVNLYKPILTLKGEPIKDSSTESGNLMANEVVANMVSNSKADQKPVRQMEVARKIYNATGEIELEDADYERMKSAIKNSGSSALVVSQIEIMLNENKEE